MGRHAAPEGSAVHPIVDGALARRAADGADGHREEAPADRTKPVGWPAPPAPGGGGLGWPCGESGRGQAQAGAEDTGLSAEASAAPQRGRRRFFRLRLAA
jgi:hypothetical protein